MMMANVYALLCILLALIVMCMVSQVCRRRKLFHYQVICLFDLIDEIEKQAILFHCHATFELSNNLLLLNKLAELECNLASIFNVDYFSKNLFSLRNAITDHNFDQANFEPQELYCEINHQIVFACRDLCDLLSQFIHVPHAHSSAPILYQ